MPLEGDRERRDLVLARLDVDLDVLLAHADRVGGFRYAPNRREHEIVQQQIQTTKMSAKIATRMPMKVK